MTEVSPKPCVRCSKSHHSPAAFMLECRSCHRAWHHTCHIPPVTEGEMFKRMDADDDGLVSEGIAAWMCKRCSKKANANLAPIPGISQDQGPFTGVKTQTPEPSASHVKNSQAKFGSDSVMKATDHLSKAASTMHIETRRAEVPNVAEVLRLRSNETTKHAATNVPTIDLTQLSRQSSIQRQGSKNRLRDKFGQEAAASQQHEHNAPDIKGKNVSSSVSELPGNMPAPSAPRQGMVHPRIESTLSSESRTPIPSQDAAWRAVKSTHPKSSGSHNPDSSRSKSASTSHHVNTVVEAPKVIPGSAAETTTSVTSMSSSTQTSSNAAMPNFRTMIANMRAEGKLNPPPSALDLVVNDPDVGDHEPTSRSTRGPSEISSQRGGTRYDTHDIDDMYATPAPVPIPRPSRSQTRDDSHGTDDLYATPAPLPIPAPSLVQARYDTHDIDDMYATPAPTTVPGTSAAAAQDRQRRSGPPIPPSVRYDTHDIDDMYQTPAPDPMRGLSVAARQSTSSWDREHDSVPGLVFDWLRAGYNNLRIGDRDPWDRALSQVVHRSQSPVHTDRTPRPAIHRKGLAKRLGPKARQKKQSALVR